MSGTSLFIEIENAARCLENGMTPATVAHELRLIAAKLPPEPRGNALQQAIAIIRRWRDYGEHRDLTQDEFNKLVWDGDELEELLSKNSPPETRGEPKQDGEGIWLLMYADQDMQPPTLLAGAGSDEAARRAFERASQQWTCRLFRCVAQSGYGPSPANAGEQHG